MNIAKLPGQHVEVLRGSRCRYLYRFNESWPNSAASQTITTVMATAKRYSPAVKVSPSRGIGRTLQGPLKTETKDFHMAALLSAPATNRSTRRRSTKIVGQYRSEL